MKRTPSALAAVAAVVLAGALAAACGVPTDSSPQYLTKSSVPFNLLSPAPANRPTACPSGAVLLYFVHGQRLFPGCRPVASTTLQGALDALIDPTQLTSGLTSPIATATTLDATGPVKGLVTVDLGAGFSKVAQASQILAIAQVVYTATAYRQVAEVAFHLGGQRVQLPNGQGTLSAGPFTRSDFAAQAPS